MSRSSDDEFKQGQTRSKAGSQTPPKLSSLLETNGGINANELEFYNSRESHSSTKTPPMKEKAGIRGHQGANKNPSTAVNSTDDVDDNFILRNS